MQAQEDTTNAHLHKIAAKLTEELPISVTIADRPPPACRHIIFIRGPVTDEECVGAAQAIEAHLYGADWRVSRIEAGLRDGRDPDTTQPRRYVTIATQPEQPVTPDRPYVLNSVIFWETKAEADDARA